MKGLHLYNPHKPITTCPPESTCFCLIRHDPLVLLAPIEALSTHIQCGSTSSATRESLFVLSIYQPAYTVVVLLSQPFLSTWASSLKDYIYITPGEVCLEYWGSFVCQCFHRNSAPVHQHRPILSPSPYSFALSLSFSQFFLEINFCIFLLFSTSTETSITGRIDTNSFMVEYLEKKH